MRTDAKIGFAILAVLLAVLVVFFSFTGKKKQPINPSPVAIVTAPPAETPAVTPKVETVTPITPDVTTAPHDPTPPPETSKLTAKDPVVEPPFGDLTDLKDKTDSKHDKPHDDAGKTAPVGGNVYLVKSGDTFSSISQAKYGTTRHYLEIAAANKDLNPNRLRIGDKVSLPPIAESKTDRTEKVAEKSTETAGDWHPPTMDDVAPAVRTVSHETVSNGRTYVVKSGDSLYKISKKVFGTGRRADEIYDLNKSVIGPDRGKLKLNAELALPGEAAPVLLPLVSAATTR